MFTHKHSFSSFAVDEVSKVRDFYRDTLGLKTTEEMGMLSLKLGEGFTVMIYPKSDYVPATFTVLNFVVDDIEEAVDELATRGVHFEQYAAFDQDEKGIARPATPGDGPNIAWFTDPAGNVLAVLEE